MEPIQAEAKKNFEQASVKDPIYGRSWEGQEKSTGDNPGTTYFKAGTNGKRDELFVPEKKVLPTATPTTTTTPTATTSQTDFQKGTGISGYDQALSDEAAKKKTESESNYGATPVVGGSQTVRDTLTDAEKQLADLETQSYNAMSSLNTTTSDEEARIAAAGEAEYKNWQSTISNAEKEKALGMGKTTIGAGESGGFLNTQMAGRAALTGRYGEFAGGEIDRVKSAYDSNIDNLIAQRAAAVSQAKEMMRKAIRGEKLEGFQSLTTMLNYARQKSADINAAQQAKADSLQKMQQWALDYQQEERKNQLEMDKFIAGQADNDTKNKIAEGRLNLDYIQTAGVFADGTQTLEAKKAAASEMYQKLGLELNEKKWLEDVNNNRINQTLAQAKFDYDKSQDAASAAGLNTYDIAKDILTSGSSLKDMKLDPKIHQAVQAKLNKVTSAYKDEYKNTGNPEYAIKGSSSNSKTITADTVKSYKQILGAYNNLSNLNQVLSEAESAGKTGAFKGKVWDKAFWDNNQAKLASEFQKAIPTFARGIFGEVGVLSDKDIERYAKVVPNGSTPTEALKSILAGLYGDLATKYKNDLVQDANAGYNVSGFASDFDKTYKTLLGTRNSLAISTGQGKIAFPTKSTNPVVYDDANSYLEAVKTTNPKIFDTWTENAARDIKALGKDPKDPEQVESYFQTQREAMLMKDTLRSAFDSQNVESSNLTNVGSDTNKATMEKVISSADGSKGGQCGRFVNQATGLGLGDSYQSKMSKMDKSITKPEPGMVFVMPYRDTGHTGFIVSVNNDGTATVKDSNYDLNEKVKTHKIALSKLTGFKRI